jgi:hypothetical protein
MSKHSKQVSWESTRVAVAVPESTMGDKIAETACSRERVSQLAYSYWQVRGCPNGSPDEDWFRAACELIGVTAVPAGR